MRPVIAFVSGLICLFVGRERARVYLASFVLCDFVLRVLLAVSALAVGAAGLRDVDLWN